jgi:hypothetical protein
VIAGVTIALFSILPASAENCDAYMAAYVPTKDQAVALEKSGKHQKGQKLHKQADQMMRKYQQCIGSSGKKKKHSM